MVCQILTEGAKQFSVVVSISSKVRNVEGEAILPKSHLSDTRTGADVIYNSLHDEATLGTLMVLQVEPFLLVTRKPSLLRKAESLPTKLEDIKESMMLNGYVSHVAASQVSVKFLGSLEGELPRASVTIDFRLMKHTFKQWNNLTCWNCRFCQEISASIA